jgi:hypothetical protein
MEQYGGRGEALYQGESHETGGERNTTHSTGAEPYQGRPRQDHCRAYKGEIYSVIVENDLFYRSRIMAKMLLNLFKPRYI